MPRVGYCFPIEFTSSAGTLFGSTRDISELGLKADFGEPIMPDTTGKVLLKCGRCNVEVGARISHAEGFSAGLVFVFGSEQEELFLRAIVKVLSDVSGAGQ